MNLELTHWPLGPSSGARELAPHGNGRCMPNVVILADWHNVPRGSSIHEAQDIFAPRGTPVLAPIGGRIAVSTYTPRGGYNVKIANRYGTVQLSHFDQQPLVQRGNTVVSGQQLGVVGNSGAPRACPHLHIGARDLRGNAINLYPQLSRLAETAPEVRRPSRRETATRLDSKQGVNPLWIAGLLTVLAIASQENEQ